MLTYHLALVLQELHTKFCHKVAFSIVNAKVLTSQTDVYLHILKAALSRVFW